MQLVELLGFADSSVHLFVQLGATIGFIVYVIFAFVILKQVGTMTKTLEMGFERPIQIIAVFHLLFAMATLGFALIML